MPEDAEPLTDDDIDIIRSLHAEGTGDGEAVRKGDVAAAVRGFRDAIQHTDDDWITPVGSKKVEKCRHCRERRGKIGNKVCRSKVEEKLGEYFGAVLDDGGEERGSE